MKKITKGDKNYVVLEKIIIKEEEIAVEDIQARIASLSANIIATENTLADYKSQKKTLSDYLK